MVKRIAATLAAITVAGTLGAVSAQAAQASGGHIGSRIASHAASHNTVHSGSAVKSEDPPAGYTYEGSFYWHASCEEAGKGGIPRAWSAYVCLGDGMPWSEYDLYVKYN